jgi:Predicted O-methyltransferase
MANPFFRFKQFTVYHDKCAMKVGTDGVLLGAWANVENRDDILDMGTGTGLIALMMAQRNLTSEIVAIDSDESAVKQAGENIGNSPFADRIVVKCADFRQFVQNSLMRFDLVVSNPPYFSHSLLPPDKQRAQARHSVSLTLDDLMRSAKSCLKNNGVLSLILPFDKSYELEQLCEKHVFYVKRQTIVYPLPDSEPKRILMELSVRPSENVKMDSLIIETERHRYSNEFSDLVRDFYLYV